MNIFDLNLPAIVDWSLIVAAIGVARLWYAVPLVTSVSLVCAATRHERMVPILIHAVRFAAWVLLFMGIVVGVIQLLSWLR